MNENRRILLQLSRVCSSYGQSTVLHDLSISIYEYSIVSLIGRNGAGKSSVFRSIVGLLPPVSGDIRFDSESLVGLPPYRIARKRIALVPEDRRILRTLTVAENISIGSARPKDAIDETLELFPTLSEHMHKSGDKLSGGEQQMVAIARALVCKPRLILIDEPLEGLAPIINDRIRAALETLRGRTTVFIIEQNVRWLLGVADYHYVINQGEIVYQGSSKELGDHPEILDRHLGVQ